MPHKWAKAVRKHGGNNKSKHMRPNDRFGLKFAWTETAVVDVKPKSINRPRAVHLASAISLRQVSFVYA